MLREGEVFLGVEYMKSGVVLGEKEVSQIKGMLARGDRQMHIATYFGINQARVNEIRHGRRLGAKYRHVSPAPRDDLPPVGPYSVVPTRSVAAATANEMVIEEIRSLLQRLEHGRHTGDQERSEQRVQERVEKKEPGEGQG